MLRSLSVVLCALAGTNCATSPPGFEPIPTGGHHVLFIGNSLTYANDLPATVSAIAASAGDTIYVATAAEPDLALIDHVAGASNARAQIARGGWEFVILQQGPTPRGVCRDTLILAAKLLAPQIKAVGATPALLMTWTTQSDKSWFDDVRLSFEAAANASDGVFMPAGEAWLAAWRADASFALYGPDGYHPSTLGTFLTGMEVYERITGHDARSLPTKAFANGREMALDAATILALQRAAHDANVQFPARSTLTVTPTPAPATPVRC